MNNDTIIAIATPHGVGGIAVLRLSGEKSVEIAHTLSQRELEPNKAQFARLRFNGKTIDEVVMTFYKAPHSYTGEDVVEISCHGSSYVQQEILKAGISLGARLAEPGEYTLRAFLNGKMDLAQSEAVADLIDATSESQHRLAVNQLRGGFSKKLTEIRDRFITLTSLLELELDFSDEDVEFADRTQLSDIVQELLNEVKRLTDSFVMGNAIKNGIPVAIIGRPNVGKSTLLNALLNEERAIVSNIPGTTRDTIEETLIIEGITYRFIDTAGIRNSTDEIETAGIERSYQSAEKAQIILYLTDCSNTQDLDLLKSRINLDHKSLIVVATKADLQNPCDSYDVAISAKNGDGMDRLRELIQQQVQVNPDATMLTNIRHYEAMCNISEALSHVDEGLKQQLPADLIVIDIRQALYHLGLITGQVTNDEVLGSIFSRFCIGK